MARPAASIGPKRPLNQSPSWMGTIHGIDRNPISYLPPWSSPPPGTFSPGIHYEVDKSRRGLQQLLEDESKQGHRDQRSAEQKRREIERGRTQKLGDFGRQRGYLETDEAHELGDLGTSHSRHLGDLGINFSRDIEDLSVARIRGEENYGRTLTDLQHRYGSAAEQQAQAMISQGTNETGTEVASAAVRGANQGYDKSGIDTQHTRGVEDLNRREARDRTDYEQAVNRENEDFGTNEGRIGEGLTRHLAALAIDSSRTNQAARTQTNAVNRAAGQTNEERDKKTSRAKAEQAAYERAQSEAAFYEAHQLHPKIQFPGSQVPGAPKVPAPHVFAQTPAGAGPGTITPYGAHGAWWKQRQAGARY